MYIKKKLSILFSIFAFISLFLITTPIFLNYKNSLEKSILVSLEAVTTLKANDIETFFKDLRANIAIAQGYWNIKNNMPVVIRYINQRDNPDYIAAKKILDSQLTIAQKKWHLFDIMLINPEGIVVYCSNPKHEVKELGRKSPEFSERAFAESKKDIHFSEVIRNPAEDYKFSMHVAAPVYDLEGGFIGEVVFAVDMSGLYRIIQDTTGLGKTGETLIGIKSGDEAIFLNPLRHDPHAALTRKVSLDEKSAYPMRQATRGKAGSGIALDYRGKEVIASWRYLPSPGWGMVTKIDAREAFGPITAMARITGIMMILTVIVVIILSYVVAKSIAGPIHALHKGTEKIGEGDLDYRVGTQEKDEIGQLSMAFDQMTQHLKETTASRDELNSEVEKRKKANEFNVSLIKTIPFGMDIVDANGNILFINDKLKALAGEIKVGKKCWELYRDSREQCSACPLITGIKVGQTAAIESGGCFGGKTFQIFHTGMLYEGKTAILEIFQDITESKQLSKQRENFMSMVSHELRTPLGAIKESVSLVLEGKAGPVDEKQKEMIGIAKRNVDRLARLIDQVLDIQKIDAGRMELEINENDINKTIEEVRKTMSLLASKKGLDFILKLDDKLPRVKFDKDRITQVLTNLINNAIKFTDKGVVTVTSSRGNDFIRVSVKDTGPGVMAGDIPKLFQKFSQLERKAGGTGLGLAISKEIIQMHRGKIWAESEFGKGAAFHFTLPIEERVV